MTSAVLFKEDEAMAARNFGITRYSELALSGVRETLNRGKVGCVWTRQAQRLQTSYQR